MAMKRIFLSLLFLTAMLSNTEAQIILMDSDESRSRVEVEGTPPFIPILGVNYDQYAPLPEGLTLLCGLGIAYLMKKKRKME